MSLKKRTDFVDFLSSELIRRTQKNPQYSLRMFAKYLGVDSSRLSKILKRQRPIRPELIEKLGQRLDLPKVKINSFIAGTRRPYHKKTDNLEDIRIEEHYQLRLDQISLISEWQHYAVLELMKCQNFQPNINWIARELSQPPATIELVVQRLQRIGILKIDEKGQWQDLSEGFSTHVLGLNLTSQAHRNYQAQILELSKHALFNIDIHERDHSSIVVATNAKKIQEAKLRIKTFGRQLAEFLEDASEKDSIYHLNVGLFPIENEKHQRGRA